MINERSFFLLKLYKHYKNNFLFKEGGLYDQPNLYLEAMEIIDGVFNRE